MADSRERPTKAKKFKGSLQYKTKYNATWFSQENLKNFKDVITNSKLGNEMNFRSSPSEVVLGERCSENMQEIYSRTPMLKYNFNKVTKQLY